jgi:hypothetical protein
VVCGEAGIGKSALLEYARARASEVGLRALVTVGVVALIVDDAHWLVDRRSRCCRSSLAGSRGSRWSSSLPSATAA